MSADLKTPSQGLRQIRFLLAPRLSWVAIAVLSAFLIVEERNRRRYQTPERIDIPVREFTQAQYIADPARRSVHYGKYSGRSLKFFKRDATHFDLMLVSDRPNVANIRFLNIDAGLLIPRTPSWIESDADLTKLALVEREWNRQQISFQPGSKHLRIYDGDGVERELLHSAEISANCLNAGLWEILLYTWENGQKALYYQGWFQFPLGHYRRIFDLQNPATQYKKHWFRLEHWFDPEGTPVDLGKLRHVHREDSSFLNTPGEGAIFNSGEQARKSRLIHARNHIRWGELYEDKSLRFSAFVPPGVYDPSEKRPAELWRFKRAEQIRIRKITSPGAQMPLTEIELDFAVRARKGITRLIVSGLDLKTIPTLEPKEYPKGFAMPLGLYLPPVHQSYDALLAAPPHKSPFFSLLLDEHNRWLNHHDIGIDGVVLHKDPAAQDRLHLYLLSYERQTVVGHFNVELPTFDVPGREKPSSRQRSAPGPIKSEDCDGHAWDADAPLLRSSIIRIL